jgi:hypothetical protein
MIDSSDGPPLPPTRSARAQSNPVSRQPVLRNSSFLHGVAPFHSGIGGDVKPTVAWERSHDKGRLAIERVGPSGISEFQPRT